MNGWHRLTATCLAVASIQVGARELPPLQAEDIFQLAYVSEPIVDGAGERILYLRHTMDIMQDRRRSNLWSVMLDSGEQRPITSGAINVSSPALAPDDNRVAWVAKDDSGSQIFMHWLDSGQSAQLTRLPAKPKHLAFSPDGQWLAFTMLVPHKAPSMGKLPPKPGGAEWAKPPVVVDDVIYRRDGSGDLPEGFSHLFVMPAAGGSPRQLTHGDFHHNSRPAWGSDSESLYVSANRNPDWERNVVNTELYRIDLADGDITALTDRKGPDFDVRVSPDGKLLAYLGYDDEGLGYHRTRLYLADRRGNRRRELLPDLDRDIENPQWSADGEQIYFQYDDRGDTWLAVTDLDGNMRKLANRLGGTSLGRPYSGAGYAVGGGKRYAFTLGDTESPAELATGVDGGEVRRLTGLNDNLLRHRALAPVEELWLESSADGLDIQAWVAKPPGFDPRKQYPLLLEIHGGPFTNYGFRFSAEVQLYAAAGYVVLYVNPRGSTSYGADFANEIHHNYPGQDYDDLISAVDAVIDKGYVDPERLYVTGGSGGGVLTAWIVGMTDRFRAAVVAKPVINWASFVLTADMSPFFTRYWFADMPWENPMAYWRRSPLSLVGNVSTPTMLLTGESDLRTPMAETEQYYQALKLRGIDTAMVRIPGASHSIAQRPSQLLGKVAAILEWFSRYPGEGDGQP
jgi:dipeptidyl aminopeptidase/acylaminoacyl peptidase